jgi:hypothetical protein
MTTRYVALTQARIASKHRLRLVRRGTAVPPPADHARHVVSLLSKVPAYGQETRAFEDRVFEDYAQRYCELFLVAPLDGGR